MTGQLAGSCRYRTHTCGELRKEDVGKRVRLAGWVHNIRDLGGVLFFELRDHYGLTQLVIRPDSPVRAEIETIRKEWVISVGGGVRDRGEENFNPALETGEVELEVDELEILGPAEPLPFSVFPEAPVPEELRLRHRYLDLRRSKIHSNIILRSRVTSSLRRQMQSLGFNEISTPILTASTPEGARDYLVPSRVYPGKFYALPQAPQQFKQLLMVAGFDRYFQIAPCFRDEAARADRSPGEFYQLDLEMSFVTQEDVLSTVEGVLYNTFVEFSGGRKVSPIPFPRIPYDTALLEFGCDKPDLRNPLRIRDVSFVFEASEFRAYAGKTVRALTVPQLMGKPRSYFDKLVEETKANGAEGLGWIVIEESGELKGAIAKFVPPDRVKDLLEITGAKPRDAVFFIASENKAEVNRLMAWLRNYMGALESLTETDAYEFCWIVDYPMYEWNEETRQIEFSHNPFSMPVGGLEALNSRNPLDIRAYQYDAVCNGVEISSGAIRNHRPDVMYKAFEIAGYPPEEVDRRFGGMIQAFKRGAPPHGGIAPGLDRMVMLLAEEPNLREVVAFPLAQNGQDLLMGAPSEATPKQLEELHIRFSLPPPK